MKMIKRQLLYVYGIIGNYDHEDWRRNIPQIAQYSVPEGESTFVSLKSLEKGIQLFYHLRK
jgi:hypothetical protein